MKRPIPEIDHNAIVGYTGLDDNGVVVYLGVYAPCPYSRQENHMPKGSKRRTFTRGGAPQPSGGLQSAAMEQGRKIIISEQVSL